MSKKLVVIFLVCFFALAGGFVLQQPDTVQAKTKVSYKIVNKEASVKNQKGNVVSSYKYQLVVVKGTSDIAKKINKSLNSKYKSFLKSYGWLGKKFDGMEKLEVPYEASASSEVTYNAKGILSVRIYMYVSVGGAHPAVSDYFGYNFNLKNGKIVKLQSVVKGTDKSIRSQIYQSILKKIKDKNIAKSGQKYKLFNFYLKNGKAYICFPHESLSGWAVGEIIVTQKSIYKAA